MRILWMSSVIVSDDKLKSSGGWSYSMLKQLSEYHDIELCNISWGNTKKTQRCDYKNIEQYILPGKYFNIKNLRGFHLTNIIKHSLDTIIENFKPDIIHIWGVESLWGIYSLKQCINRYPVLLEIQGFRGLCANKYYYGLNLRNLISMIGLAELIRPDIHPTVRRILFKRWGIYENFIIKGHHYINTQSDWTRRIIKVINPNAYIYKTDLLLRNNFFKPSSVWIKPKSNKIITITNAETYKGTHIILQAFALVKATYPQMQFEIIGIPIHPKKIFNKGYVNFLVRLSKKLNIYKSVLWSGMLQASEIIEKMQQSALFVYASSIESYCQVIAEAMTIGIPVVSTDSAAIRELAINNKTALSYSEGDYYACASCIIKIIENPELAQYLSKNSIEFMKNMHNKNYIVQNQLDIYNDILSKKRI